MQREVRFLASSALLAALLGFGAVIALSDGTAIGHNHAVHASIVAALSHNPVVTDSDGTAIGYGK